MLLLFPGAGSDASHRSLVTIEQWVDPHACRRVDFPYRRAGRKAPDRAPVLMAAVRDELDSLAADEPVVLGGRSMGGRICSMVAAGADGAPPPAGLRGLVLAHLATSSGAERLSQVGSGGLWSLRRIWGCVR